MTDVADEAAGEVIYSYDGDEDPVVTKPPPLPQSTAVEGGGMPTAPEAFEAFAGKVYKPTSLNGAFYGTGEETTLERLARLQKEMDLLEQDLQTTDNSDAASGTPNALLGTVQEMKSRLQKASKSVPPQQKLTANIGNAATSLQTAGSPSKAPDESDPASVTASGSILEARLKRLESWIGSGAIPGSSSADASLSDRLASLETTIEKLDEKELELKAKKAKVIRQDLEAASKARNKLMVGAASTTSSSSSDSKTITELHDMYVQLQGMAPHLPLLTQRLQALSRQHQEAALQVEKLKTLSDLSKTLTTQVCSLEQAVQTTEDALVQSAQQMQQNIQALDRKLG